ncbi:hypothetical protein [Pseudomonas frederiksbergensis]|uniref:hypothetical protein n=1 Tax=Pseudomonas frederiksbergensis TaxID=104087 RepID=UPI003D232DDC
MSEDQKEKAIATWRRLLEEPEIRMSVEEQFEALVMMADELKRTGVIDRGMAGTGGGGQRLLCACSGRAGRWDLRLGELREKPGKLRIRLFDEPPLVAEVPSQ